MGEIIHYLHLSFFGGCWGLRLAVLKAYSLALCPGTTLRGALGTILSVWDRTWIFHMQIKCLTYCMISLPPIIFFF